jgi:large subunit ribosomal protein L31
LRILSTKNFYLNLFKPMNSEIHPKYREVVFQDIPTGETFITRSTMGSSDTIELDGNTYPLIRVEISSASHPFYTGKQNIGSTQGRVEKFMEKYDL